MDKAIVEEAYNHTFSGITLYYRDCQLQTHLIEQYKVGKTIEETGFTDVSSFAKGLKTNFRFVIASNKAANLAEMNPDMAKYGFNVIAAPAHFKVLDLYTIGNQTQALLLNFEEPYLDVFQQTNSNIEDKIIAMARKSFDSKIKLAPNETLYDDYWRERTKHPIGIIFDAQFFDTLSATDNNQEEEINDSAPVQTPENQIKTQVDPKKGFWQRLFNK